MTCVSTVKVLEYDVAEDNRCCYMESRGGYTTLCTEPAHFNIRIQPPDTPSETVSLWCCRRCMPAQLDRLVESIYH